MYCFLYLHQLGRYVVLPILSFITPFLSVGSYFCHLSRTSENVNSQTISRRRKIFSRALQFLKKKKRYIKEYYNYPKSDLHLVLLSVIQVSSVPLVNCLLVSESLKCWPGPALLNVEKLTNFSFSRKIHFVNSSVIQKIRLCLLYFFAVKLVNK